MGYTARPALAMISEFMHRGSLFKVLSKQRGMLLDIKLQRTVAIGVARGMAYLHSRSPPIVHLVRSYFTFHVIKVIIRSSLLFCPVYIYFILPPIHPLLPPYLRRPPTRDTRQLCRLIYWNVDLRDAHSNKLRKYPFIPQECSLLYIPHSH